MPDEDSDYGVNFHDEQEAVEKSQDIFRLIVQIPECLTYIDTGFAR